MEYTDGTLKYNVISLSNKSGGVLYGVILAFSGAFDSNGYPIDKATGTADTTWHLCDGTNGTPDLRGRFILGASDAHAVGSTGGEEKHTLTESELPKVTVNSTGVTNINGEHKHNIPAMSPSSQHGKRDIIAYTSQGYYDNTGTTDTAGGHNHSVTASGAFGGGQAHNNMPPYYTLSYIMKL